MSDENMKEELDKLRKSGVNISGPLRSLYSVYCRQKNLDRALEMKNIMEKSGYSSSPVMSANLIEVYIALEKKEEALKLYQELLEKFPDFALDDYKILNLASVLSEKGEMNEAMELIQKHHSKFGCMDSPAGLVKNVLRILKPRVESGDANSVVEWFDFLRQKGYLDEKSVILTGQIVQVYLNKNDLKNAIREFENCVKLRKCSPCTNELFVKLIRSEDTENLQKVVDLAIEIHGKSNVMLSLAACFIECEKPNQAIKVLQMKDLRFGKYNLEWNCEMLIKANKVDKLAIFLEITKDLGTNINRDVIYSSLIKGYCKLGDSKKAIDTWTAMRNENLKPSAQVLSTLADFLRSKNLPVPFDVPLVKEAPKKLTEGEILQKNIGRNQNWPKRTTADEKTERLRTSLLNDDLQDSIVVAKEMYAHFHPLPAELLMKLLKKLSLSGNVDTILEIGRNLNIRTKKESGYIDHLAFAYHCSGSATKLLDILEQSPESKANPTQFPKHALLRILEQRPELEPRVEVLAKTYKDHGYSGIYNTLWIHNMKLKNYEKAEEIYRNHLSSGLLIFKILCKHIVQQKDIKGAEKLVEFVVNHHHVNATDLGVAYSTLLNVKVLSGNLDDALTTLDKVKSSGFDTKHLEFSTISKLHEELKLAGKSFPSELLIQDWKTRLERD